MSDAITPTPDGKFCTTCGKTLPAVAHFCSGCGSGQPPVRPLVAAPSSDAGVSAPSGAIGRSWSRRLVFVGVVVVMTMLAATIAFAAVTQFVGDSQATAEYYPEDTYLYMSADFLQLRERDRTGRFADAMEAASGDLDFDFDLFEALELQDIEIDLEDDIIPWIGRTASIGVFDAVGDEESYSDFGAVSAVMVVTIRDQAGATDFSEWLLEDVADASREDLDSVRIGSWSGWILGDPRYGDSLVWVVTDEAILIGSSPEAVEVALETRTTGDNLLASPGFAPVSAAAPDNPLAMLFVSGPFVEDLFQEAARYVDGSYVDSIEDELAGRLGYGGSVSLQDDGVLVTFTEVTDGTVEGLPDQLASPAVASRLPDSTVGFGAFQIPKESLADVGSELRNLDRDLYDLIVESVDDEIGFDPFAEVLPYVGGEAVFALVDFGGSLERDFGVEIGGLVSIGITDREQLEPAVEDTLDYLDSVGVDIDRDGQLYVFSDRGLDAEVAFALTDSAMTFGGPIEVVEDWLEPSSSSLAESATYQRVEAALDMPVALFVDLSRFEGIVDLDREARRVFDVIRAFGLGYELSGSAETAAVFIDIDY